MKGTFEFNLKDGRTCTLEATYECYITKSNIVNDDEFRARKIENLDLVAYVNGEKFERECYGLYELVDSPDKSGMKVIWGLGIGFENPEDAERYEKWIAGIIENGKSDEVRDYEESNGEKLGDLVNIMTDEGDNIPWLAPIQAKPLLW